MKQKILYVVVCVHSALHFAFPLRNTFVWRKKKWFLGSAAKMGPLASFLLRVYAQLKREKETCAKTIKYFEMKCLKKKMPPTKWFIFDFLFRCNILRCHSYFLLNSRKNNIEYLLLRRYFFIVNVLPVRIMFKLSLRENWIFHFELILTTDSWIALVHAALWIHRK